MKERCRDGCRTSLLIAGVVFVPAIFHTSLPLCHPYITIHFMEMIFSTCSNIQQQKYAITLILDGAAQQKSYLVASRHYFECMEQELLLSKCNYNGKYSCHYPAEVLCKHGILHTNQFPHVVHHNKLI